MKKRGLCLCIQFICDVLMLLLCSMYIRRLTYIYCLHFTLLVASTQVRRNKMLNKLLSLLMYVVYRLIWCRCLLYNFCNDPWFMSLEMPFYCTISIVIWLPRIVIHVQHTWSESSISKCSIAFLGNAVVTSCRLIGRIPSFAIQNKVPLSFVSS